VAITVYSLKRESHYRSASRDIQGNRRESLEGLTGTPGLEFSL